MPEIQPSEVTSNRFSPMGNDRPFRIVVFVLGLTPVALAIAAMLISPP
jgi:hypothetical protein